MKLFNCGYNMFRLYNRNLWLIKSFHSSFLKHQFFVRNSSSARGINYMLLNNPGVQSYLDKFISEDYSNLMSKPNVIKLISAIRTLKLDLESLNEFDIGQYYIILLYRLFN